MPRATTTPASCPDADFLDEVAVHLTSHNHESSLRVRRIAQRLRECHLVERAAAIKCDKEREDWHHHERFVAGIAWTLRELGIPPAGETGGGA